MMIISEEIESIKRWVEAVRSRVDVIGKTERAETGEEFTTSGELELDHRVAAIVLNAVQNRLPNYGFVNSGGSVVTGRTSDPIHARDVQLLPSLLFTIDWASTAPGVSWPESYFVTYVPAVDLRIVTASLDDSDLWGFADLAIGFCRAARGPDFGVKKIIQSWWRRASGDPSEREAWDAFWAAGLIDKARAERWRDQVFGKTRRDR